MAVNFFFFACKSQQSVQASEFKTKNLHKLDVNSRTFAKMFLFLCSQSVHLGC